MKKCAKYSLCLALFLPLAMALLLLPLAACVRVGVDSTKHGNDNEGNQVQKIQGEGEGRGDGNAWCIAKPSTDDVRLNSNTDFSCSQSGVNCEAIQSGGTCFFPNTPISHASYAMNLFYRAAGKNPWNCHFDGSGIVVTQDPSIGNCEYPL